MIPAPIFRTRIVTLAHPTDSASAAQAAELEGIDSLEFCADNRHLRVTYDLRQVTLPEVTAHLAAQGLVVSQSLFARLSRAWAGFKDDNRRDQSKIVHQCCNTPPPRT